MDKEALKKLFDEARKLYPNSIGKRGLEQEFSNFKFRSKKPLRGLPRYKPIEVVVLLKPVIEAQIAYRKRVKGFVAEWKNFQTWINQQCWTEEVPEEKKEQPILCHCGCGRKSTMRIGYYWWYSSECEYKKGNGREEFRKLTKQVADSLPKVRDDKN